MSESAALEVAQSIGIGQLVSVGDAGLNATFVPFNVVERGERVVVQTHLNRVNTQWKDTGDALLIVQGPSAHVAGTDLPAEREEQKLPTVPTFNYETVHFHGRLSYHDDEAWKRAHLEALVEHFEDEWRVGTHSSFELVEAAFVALVGVELEVSRIEGKAKLGQNMTPADIAHTAQHLRQRLAGGEVADLMEEIAIPWAQARQERVANAKRNRSLPGEGGVAPEGWATSAGCVVGLSRRTNDRRRYRRVPVDMGRKRARARTVK